MYLRISPGEFLSIGGERRLDELQLRIDMLNIRSPINGTICAIRSWPGQIIRAGDPVLTVAAEQGRQILSYVRLEQRVRPQIGMTVTLRVPRTRTAPVVVVVRPTKCWPERRPRVECRQRAAQRRRADSPSIHRAKTFNRCVRRHCW